MNSTDAEELPIPGQSPGPIQNRMHVRDLDDTSLFRNVVNHLWCRYDSGGISVGRSYQAALLESFQHLSFELPNHDLDGDIVQEMRDRIDRYKQTPIQGQEVPIVVVDVVRDIQMELPFDSLNSLSDNEFTFLALIEMRRWYREDAERQGFLGSEHRFTVEMLVEFFSLIHPEVPIEQIDGYLPFVPLIVSEGLDRLRRKLADQGRKDDFERFGINPFTDRTFGSLG